MLTRVILDGPLGKKFGREWRLDISSPPEALRMIEANKPGLFQWIRDNLSKFESYKVICKYEDGKTDELDRDTYLMLGEPTEIRFVPIIQGSGNVGKIILGIVIIVFMWWNPLGWSAATVLMGYQMGASLVLGGVIGLLTPQPKMSMNEAETKNKTSYFFDGPVNTTEQGVPVQLIYGDQVLVGSHPISAQVTIDQLM